jgi:serine protease AprX
MRRSSLLSLVCLVSLVLVLTVSPPSSSGGDEPRRLVAAGPAVQVELIGESSYRVSVDGRFSRPLPRSGLLHLRYGTFDPLAAGAPAAPEHLRAPATRTFIVQFLTPPLEAYRAELLALGAKLFQYLPDEAYLVHMGPETRAQVEALPYVRWVGAYEPAYKVEEVLLGVLGDASRAAERTDAARYNVMVLEKGPRMKDAVAGLIRDGGGTVLANEREGHIVEASLTPGQLAKLIHRDEILFVDRWFAPEQDLNVARQISGADHLETVEGYSGQGVRGEVNDGGLRTTHQDFQARPPIIHRGNSTSFSHGTATYGEVFGSGAGSATARGLLPDGQGIFTAAHGSNRATATAELVNPNGPYRAVFQTNSWGSGLTTAYTSTSASLDDILFDNDILVMQSQSNDGTRNSRPQAWAKNILSVGGVRHRNTLTKSDDAWGGGASIGPAADGRIKPDLVHFYDSIRTTSSGSDTSYTNGFGGTSGATPIMAGYAGLFFQMWADGVFNGGPGQNRDVFASRPHMTTAKAILINSAAQYSFTGPTHDLTRVHQGWGMVDLRNLYDLARNRAWRLPVLVDESAVIRPLQVHTYTVSLASAAPLRVTLVYADPMGSPSAARARVNDLSLKVTAPGGATVYWGNNGLLDGVWSTPGGSANRVDTVENVFVQNAAAGTWTIQVMADEIVQDGHVQTTALDADYALVATTPAPGGGGGGVVFSDDFEAANGWTVNAGGTDTATTGRWARADPEPTTSNGPKQLGNSASPTQCLVTGAAAGASAGADDIDAGTTSIQSPPIALTGGSSFVLTFNYYLAHGTNSSADDFLRIRVDNTVVFEERGAAEDDDGVWVAGSVNLSAFAGQTIRLVIEAADASGASLVEAGVDDVRITRP